METNSPLTDISEEDIGKIITDVNAYAQSNALYFLVEQGIKSELQQVLDFHNKKTNAKTKVAKFYYDKKLRKSKKRLMDMIDLWQKTNKDGNHDNINDNSK